ncbi:MAG: hypothetical protein COB35_04440 [Gammaproteobacteria bacterium]|nr:MAG: hypothetical protein COB35_04440 [Gammaproteobacteria bacterium]
MRFFLEQEQIASLYQRMLCLHISKDFAAQHNGAIFTTYKQDSEQENRRRELLEVEQQAQKNKIIAEHGEQHFRAQISNQLYSKVNTKINNDFDNKEKLFHQILQIEDAIPAILDILSVKAASIRRIKPLVESLPWLSDDLINLVNKPQYRKRADVQINNAQVALSYIGLTNLKLVMPTFILKHYLPRNTAPFSLMKRKLWNDSISIGLAASVLAKAQNLDEFSIFTTALLSNLGRLTVCKNYITVFHAVHGEEIRKAYHNKDKRLHDILLAIKLSPETLLSQLVEHSAKIAAEMVELMNFERIMLTEPLFDLAYTAKYKDMHPVAQLIIKAQAYVAFRNLAKESLITSDEAKLLLAKAHLSAEEISLLKKSDVDHLRLKFS